MPRPRPENPHRPTPWGMSDYEREIIPGVTFYGTPSHGGIHVTGSPYAYMTAEAREFAIKWTNDPHWYEEDCATAYVVRDLWNYAGFKEAAAALFGRAPGPMYTDALRVIAWSKEPQA